MPGLLAGRGGDGARARGLLRRLYRFEGPLGAARGWCLPQRRGAKQLVGRLAVKKLADHVEELALMQENVDLSLAPFERERAAGAAVACTSVGERRDAHEISQDVHEQLTAILCIVRELNGDCEVRDREVRASGAGEEDVELLEQLIAADVPVQLLAQLDVLEFEARKDVMNMCSALLRPGMPQQIDKQVVGYLRDHPSVFQVLVDGCANEETALLHGVVLRSCARHAELTEAFLTSGLVFELVRCARHPSIDISSDAFYTLREMLLAHKEVSSEWLEQHFDAFFEPYNALLISGEYIAARQAQKLLIEILMDKHFRKVMVAYVSSEKHLQIHMNLLKDRSRVIQFEAYHIFKVFVANPAKPARVQNILYRNKEKLVALLESLKLARPEDAKLHDELQNVVDKLSRLSMSSPVQQRQRRADGAAHALRL